MQRIKELEKEKPGDNHIWTIIHETLMESITWEEKTGEWILFQINNGHYYFIGLGLHDINDRYDQNLYQEINKYIKNFKC
jgi:hypothetical protein